MIVVEVMTMTVTVFITYSKGKSMVPEGIPGWPAQLCHLVCNI